MQKVRAKLTVDCITTNEYSYNSNKSVIFSASYDPEIPEDQRFCKATPGGSASLMIDNPEALKFFVPGKKYYVDFTEVPEVKDEQTT